MLKKLIAMQKRIMDTAKAEKRELNEGEQRDFNLLQSLIDNIRSEENNGQGNAKPTENQGEQPTEPEGQDSLIPDILLMMPHKSHHCVEVLT